MIVKMARYLPPGICGKPTESNIIINEIQTQTLLDTGSTVSTINRKFYEENLSTIPIQKLDLLLDIECADGKSLPYEGFIEAELEIPTIRHKVNAILLVIPESNYNNSVPLLLGTNVLGVIMEILRKQEGEKYLQKSNLTTDWYLTFRSMHLREKELQKNSCKLAIVRNAQRRIIIPPNSNVTLTGYLDKKIPYQHTAAMMQRTVKSAVPDDLDIVPSLMEYRYMDNSLIEVEISNVTTRTVLIPEKAIIGEIQPVSIVQNSIHTNNNESVYQMDKITIEKTLTKEELVQGRNLIYNYADIFSTGDTDVGHIKTVQHRIELEDEYPFKQRYRRIPPSMIGEVRQHLKLLLQSGIIRKSHSP